MGARTMYLWAKAALFFWQKQWRTKQLGSTQNFSNNVCLYHQAT